MNVKKLRETVPELNSDYHSSSRDAPTRPSGKLHTHMSAVTLSFIVLLPLCAGAQEPNLCAPLRSLPGNYHAEAGRGNAKDLVLFRSGELSFHLNPSYVPIPSTNAHGSEQNSTDGDISNNLSAMEALLGQCDSGLRQLDQDLKKREDERRELEKFFKYLFGLVEGYQNASRLPNATRLWGEAMTNAARELDRR